MAHPLGEGVQLIQRFEGLRLTPYLCPAGLPTIGYGHVMNAHERREFVTGITRDMAEELLAEDLERFIVGMRRLIAAPMTPQQSGAILSWTFNLGLGNLRSSTLLRKLNEESYGEVPDQIRRWRFCRGRVLPGLVARREAEAQLFIEGAP